MSSGGFSISCKWCIIRNDHSSLGYLLRRKLKTIWILENRKPHAAQPGYPNLQQKMRYMVYTPYFFKNTRDHCQLTTKSVLSPSGDKLNNLRL
jgi:hypothetical protein